MTDIRSAVLSEQFEEHLQGRRLRSAVFLTYQFEPAFFEQQVLPAFLDVPLSHADSIRLVQLEDVLRHLPGEIAVYYDASGLVSGDGGSAKLDIRRIPIRHRTGVFHPKNVFLLLERQQPDDRRYPAKSLLVASLSANLTRAGWWENVECCHIEEIAEGSASRLRDELISFLTSLRTRSKVKHNQGAIRDILEFLKSINQHQHKSAQGQLYTHFFAGEISLPDFLTKVAGTYLDGRPYLEVISPYFDDAVSSAPLEELIKKFNPKEIRVFLPRASTGEALCRGDLYNAVKALPSVSWGSLPKKLLQLGHHDNAGTRFVHAKLYRFFTQNPKREICFIGSANLTRAAHQLGGNVETGFLVDFVPPRRPNFWLEPVSNDPLAFEPRTEDEPSTTTGGTRLNLIYHWDRAFAEAYWDSKSMSGVLHLKARDIEVGNIGPLPPREWTPVPDEVVGRIEQLLKETSLFLVHGDAKVPVPLLVQEEGMSHKPSILLRLSAADILRYWALLTPAQRSAFLEVRSTGISLTELGADLITQVQNASVPDTMFDRFAGIFHAFGCLERSVRAALDAKNEKEADYRLFGRKYDSLSTLLERVESDDADGDDVDRYVILMCARQLIQELTFSYPPYWSVRATDVIGLNAQFEILGKIRERLVESQLKDFADFLSWFDKWFMKRAQPSVELQA